MLDQYRRLEMPVLRDADDLVSAQQRAVSVQARATQLAEALLRGKDYEIRCEIGGMLVELAELLSCMETRKITPFAVETLPFIADELEINAPV